MQKLKNNRRGPYAKYVGNNVAVFAAKNSIFANAIMLFIMKQGIICDIMVNDVKYVII